MGNNEFVYVKWRAIAKVILNWIGLVFKIWYVTSVAYITQDVSYVVMRKVYNKNKKQNKNKNVSKK